MIDYVYWIRGAKHAELAELSIRSVKAVDRSARALVYTDDPEVTVEGAVMCRLDNADEPAMVANITAQLRHLSTSEYGRQVWFLDADVLLRKKLPLLDTDLFVTWRSTTKRDGGKGAEAVAKIMPYNYGVIGAAMSHRTIEAFTWMRQRVLNLAEPHRHWYGNQFALYELCGSPRRGSYEVVTIPWSPDDDQSRVSIRREPCDVYNFVPEGPGEDVEDKFVLHFKGGRKDLMEAYL